ncbi:MAG: DMT family transporter [Bullifex sp.]
MINYLMSFMTGAVIAVMVVSNTQLGVDTSTEVSTIVNQGVGLIVLQILMIILRKNGTLCPERKKSHWYMYFGGIFGLFILTFNYYTVTAVGATLAMALAVFGQSLVGLIFDLTGLFAVERKRISVHKWLSLAVSFAGILVMSLLSGGTFLPLYLLMGLAAGALTMTQMVYNSTFSKAKGPLFSARQNAFSGLIGMVLYSFIAKPAGTAEAFLKVPSVPFFLIAGGGVLGCWVVVSTNIVIPRIPAVYSAILLSAGQLLASLIIDIVLYRTFTPALLIGTAIMLLGIFLSFLSDRREAKTS